MFFFLGPLFVAFNQFSPWYTYPFFAIIIIATIFGIKGTIGNSVKVNNQIKAYLQDQQLLSQWSQSKLIFTMADTKIYQSSDYLYILEDANVDVLILKISDIRQVVIKIKFYRRTKLGGGGFFWDIEFIPHIASKQQIGLEFPKKGSVTSVDDLNSGVPALITRLSSIFASLSYTYMPLDLSLDDDKLLVEWSKKINH